MEVELQPAVELPLPALEPSITGAAARGPSGRAAARSARPDVAAQPADDGSVAVESTPDAPAVPLPEHDGRRRVIDLGLDGSLARDLLRQAAGESSAAEQPSIGLLREGLDARDAARGLSRSSAAVHAAYDAAGHAPPHGIGIFEVRADAGGNVVAVTLLRFGSDEARWKRVAGALREQLQKRRLRVPPGAAGLVTRLRIERGELAKDVADLGRTERGVALGQDYLGPKHRRDESTRASLAPGQLTPTLGASVTAGGREATRVIVLSERAL